MNDLPIREADDKWKVTASSESEDLDIFVQAATEEDARAVALARITGWDGWSIGSAEKMLLPTM